MLPTRLAPTGKPADPGEARSSDAVTRSSVGEETMASWQIKGLLVLGAALAAVTLAASAPAVADKPAQVAAERSAEQGGAGDQSAAVLACCMR
jgi:hypothetical protein